MSWTDTWADSWGVYIPPVAEPWTGGPIPKKVHRTITQVKPKEYTLRVVAPDMQPVVLPVPQPEPPPPRVDLKRVDPALLAALMDVARDKLAAVEQAKVEKARNEQRMVNLAKAQAVLDERRQRQDALDKQRLKNLAKARRVLKKKRG